MAKNRYRLRPKALQDLKNIDTYTYREFGAAQTDKYIRSLFTAFQNLSENPQLGRAVDYIRPELLAKNIGSHVVFFKRDDDGITIVRVLHKAMDFNRHM